MKKVIAVALFGLLLASCSAAPSGSDKTSTPTPTPTEESVTYAVPDDCNVEGLIKMAPGSEALDQTDDAKDQRDCAVGTPNSDVGVFFGYNKRTDAEWVGVIEKLKSEGYEPFDAKIAGADVWRKEDPSIETGPLCSISGHVGEVSFSATEPWVKCDDDWNRELATLLVDHAKK
jgi:hypothetical protein